MTIRPATSDDAPAITAIYNDAVLHTTATADTEPQAVDARRAWLARRQAAGYPVLVAVSDADAGADADIGAGAGVVLGWAALGPHHDRPGYRYTADDSVYIAPDARGRGVGTALLAALTRRAEAMGLHAVVASLDGGNEASKRLHAAAGFTCCGRLPGLVWKFDRWLDVEYWVWRGGGE